jgi:diaminohydroxyphosphoribosylaminopyrimidine deaminase/5-amino-6-(5-phosphoribosylamino)uracil reductase
MNMAIDMAKRGIGQTWPNPSVGCVIVQGENGESHVVGRGVTSAGGRPHAEVNALAKAGKTAAGSTVFVTLEPCSHHGKTPPCAEAIIEAKVARVVCAVQDPNPDVSGKGFELLRNAGIEVEVGLDSETANETLAGHLKFSVRELPVVTAKLATSLDGKIATHSGDSKWITGAEARARGHLERARHDAIMVGSTTAIVDNPSLTCRLPGLEARSPVRVVLDGRLRLPLTSDLVRTARDIPLWLVTQTGGDPVRLAAFEACGVEVIQVESGLDHLLDIEQVLRVLASRGLRQILAEGGGALFSSLFQAKLVDKILWFRSGKVIGGDGIPGIQSLGIDRLEDTPTFKRQDVQTLGADCLETYVTRG